MKTVQKQNNFLSYLLLLIAFFILLFVTKNIFSNLQVSLDERDMKTIELQEKQAELKELNALQKTLQESDEESFGEIQGLMNGFSDVDILEYIHTYAVGVNSGEERLIIRDVTYSNTQKTDIGFNKVGVNVAVIVSSENTLFKFLNFLTSDSQDYTFYIEDFTYPMNEVSGNIQVNIPLSLYYK